MSFEHEFLNVLSSLSLFNPVHPEVIGSNHLNQLMQMSKELS